MELYEHTIITHKNKRYSVLYIHVSNIINCVHLHQTMMMVMMTMACSGSANSGIGPRNYHFQFHAPQFFTFCSKMQ